MYLEKLKRVLPTERGLQLTFSSDGSEESLELSHEAIAQLLRSISGTDRTSEPLTLGVLGHQIVRTPTAHGLLIRTQELGAVVFSLPPAILKMLTTDLMRLASSPPAGPRTHSEEANGDRGKTIARQSNQN